MLREHSIQIGLSPLGVDNSELFVAHTGSFAKANDTAVELINAGIDVIVIDSITSMLPSSFFEKDSEEVKELDGTKQIGAAARDLGNMLKMLNYLNEKTVIIVLSQMRNKFLQHGAMHQHTGGLALDHASSTIVKLSSSAREADQIQGEVVSGDTIFKRPIGREVNWEVQKNKLGPTFGTGTFTFYYAGETIGVDSFGELVDVASSYGIVKKGGAWYNIYDEALQGKQKASAYLANNPEVVAKLEEELNERLS
jgi:recombination protein RecA